MLNHKREVTIMKPLNCLYQRKHTTFLFVLIVYIVGVILVQDLCAQHTPWTQKADMEAGTHGTSAITVDSMIYLIAGRYTDTLVSAYDPETDTWTTRSPVPIFRQIQSCAAADGKIYMMGGITWAYQPATTTVQMYDPATDTWDTTKAPMPTARMGLGTSVLDGKIYAIGGMLSGKGFWRGMRDTVEIYDPATDSWSTGASMPTGRVWFTTSVVDGKIYAIGGALENKEAVSTVEMYDPIANTWETKTPMPTARFLHSAAVVDGIIYIIGGGSFDGDKEGFVVESYDPVTDTWKSNANIPVYRAITCAAVSDRKIYLFGGGGLNVFLNPHNHGEKTVYVYDPSKDLTGSIGNLDIDKCFVKAGNDSVCITTTVNDPSGLTLYAAIESTVQTIHDSIQLFDDGLHSDGEAGDNIFANVWSVNANDEKHFYIGLHVTKEGEETIIHHMNNMASVSSIGPVVFENISYSSSDSVPNPGDLLGMKIYLKNESSQATVPDVRVKISSTDPMVSVNSDAYYRLGDIESQGINTTSMYITIKIADDCPVNTEIDFIAEITSNDISYCNDNFSIKVVEPVSGFDEECIALAEQLQLRNYPNPFSQSTTIQFNLPEPGFVTLKVYDFLGREIETLISDSLKAGDHSINLNATNLPEGIYFCRLETGAIVVTQKLLLVR